MLKKNEIPMQANLKTLNPELGDLENGSIIIPRRSIPWKSRSSLPRRALLNNFGAAGSNAALVLEERIAPSITDTGIDDRATYLFNLSAKTKEALNASILQHLQFLESTPSETPLKDICYTATARRQVYDHRVSFTCTSVKDLQAKLAGADLTNSKVSGQSHPVGFVFSGQGSLYHGMGRDLMKSSSSFKASITHCDTIITGLGFDSILEYISGDTLPRPVPEGNDIITSQCACVALEYSVAQLLLSMNIKPDYVAGHRCAPQPLYRE